MKTKKQKNNLNKSNQPLDLVMALFMIFAAIFLILLLFIVKINYEAKKIYDNGYYTNIKSVEINTDKNIYTAGEKINLSIINNEKQLVYFKPCEYLNNFEKEIDKKWRKENITISDNNDYNQVSFNKNESITKCEIELPKSGEGIYRSVVQIYYNCAKPGYCESSKTFYSNEFIIVIDSN